MKKNVLLAVTGSIACSKAELFIKQYKNLYNFKIISTYNALQFLSDEFKNNHLILSDWEDLEGTPHIELARWADLFIIYPATGNVIAKIAHGIADDLLTSTTLMFGSGIYICPAMHEEMYLNNTTQNNLKKLSQNNFIVGSRYGDLDIGDRGYGRLIEPLDLKNNIEKTLGKVIVTSGPTLEAIDAVKVITNKSSGKQGRAIAIELTSRGYETIYIHSSQISPIPGIQNVEFTTSSELLTAINEHVVGTDYLFMTAAVADFTVEKQSGKISRDSGNVQLNLIPNIDLIKSIKQNNKDVVTIAFSAQINDDLNFEKIKRKNCDYLVINNILDNNFGSDFNKIKIINKNDLVYESDQKSKSDIAYELIDVLL